MKIHLQVATKKMKIMKKKYFLYDRKKCARDDIKNFWLEN